MSVLKVLPKVPPNSSIYFKEGNCNVTASALHCDMSEDMLHYVSLGLALLRMTSRGLNYPASGLYNTVWRLSYSCKINVSVKIVES